jgi:hypothetical protein
MAKKKKKKKSGRGRRGASKLIVVNVSQVVKLAKEVRDASQEAIDSGATGSAKDYLNNAHKRLSDAIDSLSEDNVCCPQGMQIRVAPDWSKGLIKRRPARRLRA